MAKRVDNPATTIINVKVARLDNFVLKHREHCLRRDGKCWDDVARQYGPRVHPRGPSPPGYLRSSSD